MGRYGFYVRVARTISTPSYPPAQPTKPTVVSKRSIADAAVGTKRVANKEIYILSFTKEKEAIANGRTGTDQQLIFIITSELIMLKKYSLYSWVVNDCQ